MSDEIESPESPREPEKQGQVSLPLEAQQFLAAAMLRAAQGDPTHRPSAPPPLAKVSAGATSEGRYAISPSLLGANITAIESYEPHAGYVQCGLDAFNTIHEGLQNLDKARLHAAKDTSLNEAAQLIRVGKEAEQLNARALTSFERAHRALVAGITHTEKELATPLTAKADTVISAEIRRHFKELPADKRGEAIQAALDRNELPVIEALLGAPGILSGLTEVQKAHYTTVYRRKTNPVQAERLGVMQKALELIGHRSQLITREIERCIGAKLEVVAQLRATSSETERLLLLVNNPVLR